MAPFSGKVAARQKFREHSTQDGVAKLPQKRFYRQRAHANPFSDHSLE
jgi:hypothetical protein